MWTIILGVGLTGFAGGLAVLIVSAAVAVRREKQARHARAEHQTVLVTWAQTLLSIEPSRRIEWFQQNPQPNEAIARAGTVEEALWEALEGPEAREMLSEALESFRDPVLPVEPDVYDVVGNLTALASLSGVFPLELLINEKPRRRPPEVEELRNLAIEALRAERHVQEQAQHTANAKALQARQARINRRIRERENGKSQS